MYKISFRVHGTAQVSRQDLLSAECDSSQLAPDLGSSLLSEDLSVDQLCAVRPAVWWTVTWTFSGMG